MGVLAPEDIVAIATSLPKSHGTEVVWNSCDRLSDNGTVSQQVLSG